MRSSRPSASPRPLEGQGGDIFGEGDLVEGLVVGSVLLEADAARAPCSVASYLDDAGGQLTASLTSLLKAVESPPNAALVYTLTTGKHGRSTDAYSAENQFVADRMAEIESITPVR